MSNLDSFGLEDLHVGIHKVSSGKSTEAIRRLMAGPILDSNNTDASYFAMEAVNLLGESEKFGLYAIQGLEQLNHDIRVLSHVKAAYGIENLDINRFSTEALNIGGALKKIWAAIVEAFKRIIQAISNFIRSIANFFGSMIAKSQSKLYVQYKNDRTIYKSKAIIKAALPADADSGKMLALVTGSILSATPLIHKHADILNKLIAALETEKVPTIQSAIRELNSENSVTKKAYTAITKFKKQADGQTKGLSNPRKDIINLFWKNKTGKADKMAAGKFLSAIGGIEVLSETSLVGMKEMTKAAQVSVQVANKALKIAEKAANYSVKVAGKFISAQAKDEGLGKAGVKEASKGASGIQKAVREATKSSSWERQFMGYATGLILNTYSQFLKYRSYTASAVRAAGKNPGKEGSGSKTKSKKNSKGSDTKEIAIR